jgi:hypothetical protein
MPDPSPTAPQAWVEAYDEWAAHADDGDAPKEITLPAAVLPAPMARQILKLFDPQGDA